MANQDWWKAVPCHFIWKLEDNTEKNFRSVQNMLESKHEDCTISKVKTHPPFLLFRAYLHSSRFHEVVNNYEKALSLLDEAEKFIQETEEPDEREIYLLISTANRVWILNHLDREAEKTETLRILEEMWAKIPRIKEKFNALVNVTKAFALARLGRTKYEESERCYREAIKVYPNKSRWLHDLGKLVGRQARQLRGNGERKDQRLQEEIDLYRKAQGCSDPPDESIQVWLAMALYKSGKRQEAKSKFQSTSQTTSPVVYKKAQYLRRERRTDEAIHLLETALRQLSHPRAELYAQLAYAYETKEKNGDLGAKEKQLEYFENCIELEPSHYLAAQRRGILLGNLGRHEEAEEAFQAIINCPLILPEEKAEAIAEREKYRERRSAANAQ